jgi:hypothetical protein
MPALDFIRIAGFVSFISGVVNEFTKPEPFPTKQN